MENLSLEGENVIKDIRSLFRLKKRTKLQCNKDTRNFLGKQKKLK